MVELTERATAPPPRWRAVLMDLDGTLYLQRPLRARMLRELALLPFAERSLARPLEVFRRIRVFRRVREELRELGRAGEPLDELQYTRPAALLGCGADELRATIEEWIHRRPLPHLGACARPGLTAFLEFLREARLPAGVFSDYPAGEKLGALGVRWAFDLELCSTDPEVNAFKPHPAGFLRAAERLGVEPHEVLYVGDRPEVDAAGAAAAGMACLVLDGRGAGEWTCASLDEVSDLIRAGR